MDFRARLARSISNVEDNTEAQKAKPVAKLKATNSATLGTPKSSASDTPNSVSDTPILKTSLGTSKSSIANTPKSTANTPKSAPKSAANTPKSVSMGMSKAVANTPKPASPKAGATAKTPPKATAAGTKAKAPPSNTSSALTCSKSVSGSPSSASSSPLPKDTSSNALPTKTPDKSVPSDGAEVAAAAKAKQIEMAKKCQEIQSRLFFEDETKRVDISKKQFVAECENVAEIEVAQHRGLFGRRNSNTTSMTPRHLFLFKDVLVVTKTEKQKTRNRKRKGTFKVKHVVNLLQAKLIDRTCHLPPHPKRLQVLYADGRQPGDFTLVFEELSQKQQWLSMLAKGVWGQQPEGVAAFEGRHTLVQGTLFNAVVERQEARVKACLNGDHRADINARDEDGCMALHYALRGGNPNIIKQLLDHKADPSGVSAHNGEPALFIAVHRGAPKLVSLLLAAKASPSQRARPVGDGSPSPADASPPASPKTGAEVSTALGLAVREFCKRGTSNDQRQCLESMLQHTFVQRKGAPPKDDVKMLEYVLQQETYSAEKVLQLLLLYGCNARFTRASDGASAPHMAVMCVKPAEKLRLLLQHGALPNKLNDEGDTALHVLLRRPLKMSESVLDVHRACEVLFACGARMDIPGKDNQLASALMQKDKKLFTSAQVWSKKFRTLVQPSYAAKWADMMDPRVLGVHAKTWPESDGKNPQCSQCGSKFSFFFRRHHCRFCLSLVCGNCSTRTFVLRNDTEEPESTGSRVCDRCFNFLRTRSEIFEKKKFGSFLQYTCSAFDIQLQSSEMPPQPPPRKVSAATPPTATPPAASRSPDDQRKQLFGNATPAQPAAAGAPVSQKMSRTRNQLAEATDKLLERGEKIDELGKRTKQMAANASAFATLSKQLKEKQKNRFW